jgi:hypothetical protein
MSYENPTALRLGMTGTLNGWQTRVVGRVVLGMEEGGEIYYWNEFNLADNSGAGATLVYEETENGPEWKLFRPFEPLRPITAAEAALKRVGDRAELDGVSTRISLVDQSRVYSIDGTAPEGVEVGDVANYFNVERGDRMLVVSWTGDEVEVFEGRDVPADRVAAAFGLPAVTSGFRHETSSLPGAGPKPAVAIVGLVITLISLFSFFSCVSGNRRVGRSSAPEPPPRRVAPPLQLANGAQGTLGPRSYIIEGRAVLAIGTVRGLYDRREYDLVATGDQHALLVQGLTGGSKEWHLFVPVDPPADFSPFVAAAQRKDAAVKLDAKASVIAELFQASTLAAEGNSGKDQWPAGTRYGFIARAGEEWLMARWDEKELRLYRGSKLAEPDVLAALGGKVSAQK